LPRAKKRGKLEERIAGERQEKIRERNFKKKRERSGRMLDRELRHKEGGNLRTGRKGTRLNREEFLKERIILDAYRVYGRTRSRNSKKKAREERRARFRRGEVPIKKETADKQSIRDIISRKKRSVLVLRH